MRRTITSNSLLRISKKTGHWRIRSPNLCTTCKSRVSPFSQNTFQRATLTPIARRNISRRIWSKNQRSSKERKEEGDDHKSMGESGAHETLKRKDAYDSHSYEPALTWDELEKVGGTSKSRAEDWEAGFNFRGFARADSLTDMFEVTAAFRQAIVEVFTLHQAGVSPKAASPKLHGPGLISGARVRPSSNGAEGVAEREAIQQIVRSSTSDSEEVANRDAGATRKIGDFSKEDLQNVPVVGLNALWDPSWHHRSLQNLETRINVLKRAMKLTGIRVPDYAMASAITTGVLLDRIFRSSRVRKVSDALNRGNTLCAFSNVMFHDRKITLLDRERTVGRWKVAEEELRKRDLPTPTQ